MKNKKQVVVLALALVVCLLMGTTAFAAASPEAGVAQVQGVASGVYLDGDSTGKITGDAATKLRNDVNPPAGSTFVPMNVVLKNADGSEYHGQATVTLTVEGLKVGDSVRIYHQNADGTYTEIPSSSIKVENGKVTFTSTFSPIALVIRAGNGVSPKTGDTQASALWYAIAVIAICGVMISSKKVFAK